MFVILQIEELCFDDKFHFLGKNHDSMNKISYLLLLLLTFPLLLSSCISSDEENEGTPICMISSFSVGDITSSYSTTVNGKDTTYNRTISGESIYFNIDQLKGEITSVDSLPFWANITRVCPTVTAIGSVYFRQGNDESNYFRLISGSDSLDFSQPVYLRVVSSDGKYSKRYKVQLNKSIYETDSLSWLEVNSNLSLSGAHRTLNRDGILYVFADNNGNPTLTTASGTGTTLSWNTPVALSAAIDYRSVTLFNGAFFALDAEGGLYESADGVVWNAISGKTFDRLLSADAGHLYAYDGTNLVETADGSSWSVSEAADLSLLPEMPVSYAAYAFKTNTSLQNVVMVGSNTQSAYSVAWFKVSSSSDESDQPWTYINISADNPYGLPSMEDVQMARFKGRLMAIGKLEDGTSSSSYAHVFVSEDNGVTWHVPESGYKMVDDLKGSTLPLTMTACDDNLWLIQSGGKCWRGIKSK